MRKQNVLQIMNPHLHLALILAILLGLALSVWRVQVGQAATNIQVTTFEDKINTDGFCSLREAIIATNKDQASSDSPGECPAGSDADTISLPAGTYTLTRSDNGKEDSSSTGDLDIKGDLTMSAAGRVEINATTAFSRMSQWEEACTVQMARGLVQTLRRSAPSLTRTAMGGYTTSSSLRSIHTVVPATEKS